MMVIKVPKIRAKMSVPKLLPEHHKNRDFFIADVFGSLPIKDDMASMEYPIFSLATKPDVRDIHYQFGDSNIYIRPSSHGLPTIFDKDILLYLGSILMGQINKGEIPSKTLRFSVHDLMVTVNRKVGGRAYKQIKDAFNRLASVYIETNIKTNKHQIHKGFGVLDSWHIVKGHKDKDRMVEVEATVSDWFYNSFIGKEVLTIHRDYFRLRKPLERRLYEIARKYCGNQKRWKISLSALHQKTGALSPEKNFRFSIREICKTHDLINYAIMLDGNDFVHFINTQTATLPPSLDHILGQVRNDTLLKCKTIARDARLDFYEIAQQFRMFQGKNGNPDSMNGAIIGFFKHKAGLQ
jgi:plasmid replication initiation protein